MNKYKNKNKKSAHLRLFQEQRPVGQRVQVRRGHRVRARHAVRAQLHAEVVGRQEEHVQPRRERPVGRGAPRQQGERGADEWRTRAMATATMTHKLIIYIYIYRVSKVTKNLPLVIYVYTRRSGNPSEDGGVKQDTTALECWSAYISPGHPVLQHNNKSTSLPGYHTRYPAARVPGYC